MQSETLPVVSPKHSGMTLEALDAVHEILSSVGINKRFAAMSELDLTQKAGERALELFWPIGEKRSRIGWVLQNSRTLKWAWYLDKSLRCEAPIKAVVVKETPETKKAAVKRPAERTLTYHWVELQMREQALDRRIAAILKKKNLESYDDLHSTTCLWLAEWANAGTFDPFLAEGKPPSVQTLAKWVGQKLHHDRYKNGTDALTRHMTGARTQCEVRHIREAAEIAERDGTPARQILMPGAQLVDPSTPKAIPVAMGSEPATMADGFDLVDNSSALMFTGDREKDAEHALVRDIIRVRRPRAADRYGRVFDYIIAGTPKEQVAEQEGIALLRVNHLFQRVRDDMTGAPVLVDVALRILAMVSEEPWAELAEIEAGFAGNPEVAPAIELLKVRGLLEERNRSYVATKAGHNAHQVGLLA